jgi:hypothetical protein
MPVAARACGALLALAALTSAGASPALACETSPAQRYVKTEKFSALRSGEMVRVNFAPTAKLTIAETDEPIKGFDANADYQVTVAWQKDDSAVFSLRDGKDRTGTLTVARPKTLSIFEVDTRDSKDDKASPSLYKEWKMTSPALGDGVFKGVTGKGQTMTLVLHGRGDSCPDTKQFNAWTLLVYGPAGTFTLFGKLDPMEP